MNTKRFGVKQQLSLTAGFKTQLNGKQRASPCNPSSVGGNAGGRGVGGGGGGDAAV